MNDLLWQLRDAEIDRDIREMFPDAFEAPAGEEAARRELIETECPF